MSSTRSTNVPPRVRAYARLASATSAEPRCSAPVGLGAKRTRTARDPPDVVDALTAGGYPAVDRLKQRRRFATVAGMSSTTTADQQLTRAILEWFDVEGRDWPWRSTRDRWVVLVCEVCSQQTQIARAAPFVERILDRFPTPRDLARAELGELLVLWQGLGYPRRARNLWLAAQAIAAGGWPADLRELPGVGPYTDAAIRCFADEEPVVPPDINTRRVLARCFPAGAPTADDDPLLAERAWTWGSAVMELGQTTCRAKARCDECPVRELCPSAGTEDVIASPRQAAYAGSMRQRRGTLLKAMTTDGFAAWDDDPDAAQSLVSDGLAARGGQDGELLVPPLGTPTDH